MTNHSRYVRGTRYAGKTIGKLSALPTPSTPPRGLLRPLSPLGGHSLPPGSAFCPEVFYCLSSLPAPPAFCAIRFAHSVSSGSEALSPASVAVHHPSRCSGL
ncbi:hypothetical protein BDZ91DRAFT_745837 [Kalaharituber pfeilii]|nr:hypothetical protein BDZ91DRAFT_745837 [Kalaharituber pfeilii]